MNERPELRSRRELTLVALAVVVCALARIGYLVSSRAEFNADEATTGIMVRNILHGQTYVFFPGQHYGGTFEAYLQAGVYLILRLPQNPFTLRLVLVVLSMGTCVAAYLIGRRLLSSSAQAILAAFVYAVSPWFNVIGSATSLGFYVVGQLLPMVAIYCTLRLDGSRPDWGWSIAAGVAWGLALWTTIATVYFLVPVAIWLAPVAGRSLRVLLGSVGGLVVGGLPLWWWLAVNRRLPLPPDPIRHTTVPQRLGNLFDPVLREYIGVAYPHARGDVPVLVQFALLVALLVWYASAIWRRRRGLLNLIRFRGDGVRPGDVLLAVPFVVVIAYAASTSTWYTGTPRYLYTTYPLFAIAIGSLAARRSVRWPLVAGSLIVAVSAALSLRGVWGPATDPSVAEQSRVFAEVGRHLQAEGELYVWADYWTAMPLQYYADGRVTVAVAVGSYRFTASQDVVAAHRPSVFVSSPLDGGSDPIASALRNHHVTYRATTIGFVTIYDQLPAGLSARDIGLNR